MIARGATESNVSGCLPDGSSIERVSAALLAKALACGREGAAFGKCAACGGHTVGLDKIRVLSFVDLLGFSFSYQVGCNCRVAIFYLAGWSFHNQLTSFIKQVGNSVNYPASSNKQQGNFVNQHASFVRYLANFNSFHASFVSAHASFNNHLAYFIKHLALK